MKQFKITIEERVVDGSTNWVCRHGVGEKAKYYMEMPKSTGKPGNEGWTRERYIKKVKKDNPNWLITNHILVPDKDQRVEKIPTAEDIEIAKSSAQLDASTFDAPTDKEVNDAKEIVMEAVDEDTGEIHDIGKEIDDEVKSFDAIGEDSKEAKENPEPVKSIKTEDMETNNESTAKAEVKSKPSLVSRTIRVGLGNLVTLTALPIHLGVITLGDVCYATGGLIAKGEVALQNKLGRLPETIELQDGSSIPMTRELAELAVLARTKGIQNNVKRIAVKPISYAKSQFSKKQVEVEAQAV